MANWCTNDMIVYSNNLEELEKFRNFLVEESEKSEKTKNYFSYQILIDLGFKEEQINACNYVGCCEEYIGDISKHINGYYHFTVGFISRWSPAIEMWNEILNHFKGLKQVTLAEETGCAIYINTDVSREFFKENYYFDYCNYQTGECVDEHYFETEEELCKEFNKVTGIECKTFAECEEAAKKLNEGDVYCGVYEY